VSNYSVVGDASQYLCVSVTATWTTLCSRMILGVNGGRTLENVY